MIKHFITHDGKGRILREVSCPADLVALQRLRPGEFFLEGKADSLTQKVIGQGQFRRVVDKTPAELDALKKKSPKLRFD